jgi:amphi-Trp domain-containing protein
MASEKQSVEFNGSFEPGAAADYLEALARGLRDGRVLIESGDRSISLDVGTSVELEFEAKTSPEKGKSSIELAFSWLATEPAKAAPASLLIASGSHAEEYHGDLVIPGRTDSSD